MQKYLDYVQSKTGKALEGVSISVYKAGTSTLATLYSDNGSTTMANPLTSQMDGSYWFYAANGLYDLVYSLSGYSFDTGDTEDVRLYDPSDHYYDMRSYADFSAALTAIGSATATLLISADTTVSSSATVPSTLTLWFVGSGQLSISSGQTATINGPIVAAQTRQIFSGSGQVNLGKSIVGYAPWWGVTAGDTTDHRADWGKVITSLNTAGGGTVIFPPGPYRFYNNGGSTDSPGTITGATGVTILGYGATLALDPANTAWTSSTTSNFLVFNSSNDIVIDGFNGTGPTLTQDGTFHGVTFVRFLQGCRNVTLPAVRLSGWAAAYIVERSAGDADSYISRGFQIGLVDVTNTMYGVSLQRSGNETRIGLIRSNDVYRSLIAYGLEDLDVSIESTNPKGINADVLLAAQSQTGDQIPLRRVHLRYRNVDSTSTGNGAGMQFYFAGHSAAGTIEDVSLEFHLRYGGSDQMGPTLLISKVLDNGSVDGTGSRGHIMRDVRISAFLRGEISTAFLGSVPITWMPGTVWTGETIENLTFERVRYVSNTATTALSISGLMTATFGGTVVFRDVDVGTNAIDVWGTSTPAAPTAGRFRFERVTASNLDDFADSTLPLRNIFANSSPVTVPLSWDGLTIINHGASGTVAYNLPAAVAGRQYRFYRKASQTMRIDPNGSEVIRGGGAGKYLSLDSDGALASLECMVDGTWEIVDLRGTTSFEP